MKKEYCFKLRNKKTKEFEAAWNGRTIWATKPKKNMCYDDERLEIVKFELVEVEIC